MAVNIIRCRIRTGEYSLDPIVQRFTQGEHRAPYLTF
jgi:hypothetical protein